MQIQKLRCGFASEGVQLNLGSFTDSGKDETKVMCRLSSPVGKPQDRTFARYARDALLAHMVVADGYGEKSETVVSAKLNDIYGSRVLGNTYREFDITLESSNGEGFQVVPCNNYEPRYRTTSVCSGTQRSFVPAAQKLNGELFAHSKPSAFLK